MKVKLLDLIKGEMFNVSWDWDKPNKKKVNKKTSHSNLNEKHKLFKSRKE